MSGYQNFKILKYDYFEQYKKMLGVNLKKSFAALPEKNNEFKDFDFYLASASTYSSNIEGNSVSFDTFLKHKMFGGLKRTKEIQEIENLISAYQFAQNNPLTFKNFLGSHKILSKKFLIKSKQGKVREERVGVFGQFGLVYMAIEPEFAKQEMQKLFDDIHILQNTKTDIEESFYFASMIHLVFVKIHPFMDGNGRSARLIEKWFLSEKMFKKTWNIESEKYYFQNRPLYYENVHLGPNYYEVNYNKCLPFLLMLPESFKQ